MIYTITTNPSLDYYLKLNDFYSGTINRTFNEYYDAAGKGVNVSKILDSLNISSIAMGFLGGFVKDYYLDIISKRKNIQPQFTVVKDNTRINVKIKAKNETSLNATGPNITDEEYAKFSKRFSNIYDSDYVVISGNIQQQIKDRLIEDTKLLINDNVKVIIDSDNCIVDELIYNKPFMVKIDNQDIEDNENVIIEKGKECINKGARYCMYYSPHSKSYLFENGKYYVYDEISKIDTSLTGSSDGLVAGFLWASLKGANGKESFIYANAVITSLTIFDEYADLSIIEDNYKKIELKEFSF